MSEIGGILKKLLIGVLVATLVAGFSATPSVAEDNLSYGEIPSNATEVLKISDGYRRVSLDERASDSPHSSMFIQTPSRDGVGDWDLCTDVTKGNCKSYKSKRLLGGAILPICEDAIENCIESLWVYKEGAEPAEAKFLKNIDGYKTAANDELGIPRGSTTALFESESTPHSGGNQYAVTSSIAWGKWPGEKVFLDAFDLRVAAVKEIDFPGAEVSVPDNCVAPKGTENAGHRGVCGGWSRQGCVYGLVERCGSDQKFSENTRIGVKLRLTNKMTGWLRGRIKDPIFSVKKLNNEFNLVTIDASPVNVPRLYIQYKTKDIPSSQIKDQGTTWGYHWDTLTYSYHADSKAGVDVVGKLRKAASDTASGETNLWTVSSFDSSYKRCLTSRTQLQGIVTTNAMAYMGTEPEWKGGTLNYKVSGMHYLADGKTVATGTYDLVMRSSTARCLYGFSKAPIYAVVSVRSASGEKKTATTVVSEKNGWLKLAAYNFTFSSPSIQVKLTQKKAN